MEHLLATVFVCAMLATSACSHFDESVAAYEGGNYKAALWEWRRLAKVGYPPVLYNLGVMYYEGKGVPQDTVQAYMWLNLAAGQGYENALDTRQIVADEMTASQIVEAQRRAREWWLLGH